METSLNKNAHELLISVLGNISDTEPRQCIPLDDKTTLFISIFLCVGLVISYLPQVFNKKKSKENKNKVLTFHYSTIELLPIKQVKDLVLGFYCSE